MSQPSPSHAGAARIDRWLFAVRLFSSRSLAARAVAGGRVHVNGGRVKAAHELRPGDQVTFVRGTVEFECAVSLIPSRRGPASEAVRAYQESAASAARMGEFRTRMRRAAGLTPRPPERPGKHDRALLRRLRGRG
ncbi:MAG: ribosome-associated heat shock protein Hsp15 [Steroidobacteraceae bacterium]